MSFWKRALDYLKPRKDELAQQAEPVDQEPKAEFELINGKVKIKSYNQAFVDDLKTKLGGLSDGKTDDELVELYLSRENIEREEPKLEVLHMGMNEDGTVKMQLDWNRSFIMHLRDHGIEGETEEDAIEMYLQMLHRDLNGTALTQEDADHAFADIDAELRREFDESAAELRKKNQRGTKRRRSFGPPPDMTNSI